MFRRFLPSCFSWLILLALFLGISFPISAVPQVLNIGNGAEIKDLDPHVVSGIPEHHIISELFEGLVGIDPKTLEPTPGVAESWTISPDKRIYTFQLRKDAKWSNGEPLTSEDFVYSWRRILDPAFPSVYSYNVYPVKNAEKYQKSEIKDPNKIGVKALGPHTLRVTLEHPTDYFLSLLYHYTYYPVPRKTIEKYKGKWTRPENIVGNGPFVLKQWHLNKVIEAEPNPYYWDKSRLKLQKVRWYPVDNRNVEETMYRGGQLDITDEIPIEKFRYWKHAKPGHLYQNPWISLYYFRLNTTRPPLDNPLVRRALAITVDREKLAKYVLLGMHQAALAFAPEGLNGFSPGKHFPLRTTPEIIQEAKGLLKKAGYPEGKGMPSIEILYNSDEAHRKVAEAIQAMWKQALGITAKLFNQEWKVYLASMDTLNYSIARSGWIGDYGDPNSFLDLMTTGNPQNRTGWSSPEYDRLIHQAASEADANKRRGYFSRCEELIGQEVPVIPLYNYKRIYLKRPTVQGWEPNIMDWHPLKYVSLVKK